MLDFQIYRKLSLTAATLMVLSTLAGCGGGGNGNPIASNLTQAQAQQLGSAVSNDVSKALAGVVGNPAVPLGITTRDNMLVALQGNNSQTASQPQVTCTLGTSCMVSGTYMCPDGGSITVSGSFMVMNGGMSASGTFTLTPTMCSDGTLVIDGDPKNPVMVSVTSNNVSMTTTVTVMISGNVNYKPVPGGQFPSGSCSFDHVTVTISVSDSSGSVTSSSIIGSICNQTINSHVP